MKKPKTKGEEHKVWQLFDGLPVLKSVQILPPYFEGVAIGNLTVSDTRNVDIHILKENIGALSDRMNELCANGQGYFAKWIAFETSCENCKNNPAIAHYLISLEAHRINA